eukprot:CAMPEP_0185725432 /NCGR_PEP_ID=MMETSP1171-20130828/1702_1 /TAXON_ID=374046 /ORGANISM="Helicotheca tamensis, Strain CCMP826" /LENGTH=267 /DNA_ID=CAMNT_0028393565 /DNA_START=252 /DNA_END=1055 /DNA_ORIENTATION=+
MKSFSFATVLLVLSTFGNSSAFSTNSMPARSTTLRMSETIEPLTSEETMGAEDTANEEATTPSLPTMSQSMPFMARPAALTGALAGDVGFDPMGFARSGEDLMNYREAEVKHARLAMLAAAGWPLSEVFDKKIASALNLAPVLDANDRVPSLLNGGLGKISPLYWIGCLGVAAAIDVYGISRSKSNDPEYFPGNFGFDPLGAYPKGEEGRQWMQLAEIKNGRLAMIAVTAFAVQEAVSQVGVVDETPLFFFPLMQTLHQYANSGYIQ